MVAAPTSLVHHASQRRLGELTDPPDGVEARKTGVKIRFLLHDNGKANKTNENQPFDPSQADPGNLDRLADLGWCEHGDQPAAPDRLCATAE